MEMKRLKPQPSLPEHISPMLAVLSDMPAAEEDYAFEFKWDGYRILCFFDGRRVRLESRNQKNYTLRFPEICGLAEHLPYPVVLDGEMVALDAAGRPDFGLLQRRTSSLPVRGKQTAAPTRISYLIFDLLYDNSGPVMNLSYPERRERLNRLKLSGDHWRVSPVQYGKGHEMYDLAVQHGIEGLIAKKQSSIYEQGRRSPNWKKIKIIQSQEFVIAGWQPGEGGNEGGIRSLLLGYYEKGRLQYAGNVGTGFSNEARQVLLDHFNNQNLAENPFQEKNKGRGNHFLKPELVAEIEFRGWTLDGKVRQASYKGIRTDKNPRNILRERKRTGKE